MMMGVVSLDKSRVEGIMSVDAKKTDWGVILALGSVWGLSEAALGMSLRQCASTVSGSMMTGAALFFLAAAWAVAPRFRVVAGMVVLAVAFKLFDAALLGLPVRHGAVANPIFAIVMEGAAFLLLIAVVNRALAAKALGQGLSGGLAALVAVNLFPLVKFATGIPACVVPGTGYPLALYYAPLAVVISALTVPVGFLAGAALTARGRQTAPLLVRLGWLAPAVLVVCLAGLTLLRLV
jgi:hypothetical protein